MPPAPGTTFKIDYVFNDSIDPIGAGWTETFYINASGLFAALSTVNLPVNVNARLGLLHPQYFMSQIRVSDVAVLRDSTIFYLRPNQGAGQYPANIVPNSDTSEQPWDGVLFRLDAGVGAARRMFIMRGIPSDIIANNFQYQPTAAWNLALNAWIGRFVSTGHPSPVPYLVQQRAFVPLAPPSTILIGADQRSIVIGWAGAVPVQVVAGAFVQITGSTGVHFVNKIWKIRQVVGLSAFTFPGRRVLYGTVGGPITAALVQYNYVPINALTPVRGAKRDTGRPFGLLRGRARVRLV